MDFTLTRDPQLTYRIAWAKTLESWPALPTPLTFTCDEYLGNPEQEILSQSSAPLSATPQSASPRSTAPHSDAPQSDPFRTPEIDPDEFESAYLWFLA
jgi:hypothetical protein